jgi:diguanylate cyclase (GGDEF)-like protein
LEPDVSAQLDAPPDAVSLADNAFENLPFSAVILGSDLRLRMANAAARTRLKLTASDAEEHAPFDTVLARARRMPTPVRLRLLSSCGTAIREGNGHGYHDTVFNLTSGHAIALFVRDLGMGHWLVVLQDRHGRGDPDAVSESDHLDSLTDVGNRRFIEAKTAEALADGDADHRPALVVFDIDRFRLVNDRHGRKGGDALLRAVVGRVRQATREADQIARLDGDKFAVLQQNGEAAELLAPRLVDLLCRPYLIRGEVASIGVSVGVARAAEDGTTASLLLRNAEFARHEAKQAGGQTWRHYDHDMADRARLRQELEADLRKAVAGGQFTLAYQPRVALRTRAVAGFDSRIVWTHPARGKVPQAVFTEAAEDIGLMGRIGDRALRDVCRDAALWPEPMAAAVSVHAAQLASGQHFVSLVSAALRETRLPARRLELMIAEPILVRHGEEALILLRDLHELGVRISLDDFGSGPTSLRQARSFPFDAIRIDRNLIRVMDSSNDADAMVRAIAAMGTVLGLPVIAKGVATKSQARMAEAVGCSEVRGYLVGGPVAAEAVPLVIESEVGEVLVA